MATGFRTPELDSLQKKGQWKSIAAAKTGAEAMRHELESIAIKMDLPADCSLVVFGSLARGEWTDGSDLDWVLLVDGQVSGAHYDAMLKLRQSFEQRHPGSTGTFGGLAFSHDLVHLIGGQDDTNRNLTLRMLLLLESAPVGGADAYNRVINALLDRYLIEPSSFSKTVTPRFLLNDLVRYWRTIAVDYADKFHDQAGAKAVLRNVKLRFSRKLIYAAGLDVCLGWYRGGHDDAASTTQFFRGMVDICPLELMAKACRANAAPLETVDALFGNYDRFLGALSDQRQREELQKLRPVDAVKNELFLALRDASHHFQDALSQLFSSTARKELLRYAIF